MACTQTEKTWRLLRQVMPGVVQERIKMKIRKQVYELTPKDLDKHPAWEFALDEEGEEGQDEATVRPIMQGGPVDPANGMCIVKAEFALNDGTIFTGFLTPPVPGMPSIFHFEGDDGSSQIQPSIVTDNGHVMFWYGLLKPSSEGLAQSYKILGKMTPTEVFPIRYRSIVDLATSPVEGEIKGFMHVEKVKSRFLRRKQVVRVIQE